MTTNRENKLSLEVESVSFMGKQDKKLQQYKNLTTDEEPVTIKINVYNSGLRLYGSVRITNKQYKENIHHLEKYLLENHILIDSHK